MHKAIAYYRVSTTQQGRSGLGLEAQQAAVRDYASRSGAALFGEFTEIESGRHNDRPELAKALKQARLIGAKLVIAKLDRLTRNTQFLLTLIDSGAELAFLDLPQLNGATGRFMLTQMAAVAELEAGLISERTKAALAAAKARGVKLGNPNGAAALLRSGTGHKAGAMAVTRNAQARAEGLAEVIRDIQGLGTTSLSGIAKELNERHIRTPRGGQWHAMSVKRTLERI